MDPVILDKDADDDGFPDEGVQPLLCGAWPTESNRPPLLSGIAVTLELWTNAVDLPATGGYDCSYD